MTGMHNIYYAYLARLCIVELLLIRESTRVHHYYYLLIQSWMISIVTFCKKLADTMAVTKVCRKRTPPKLRPKGLPSGQAPMADPGRQYALSSPSPSQPWGVAKPLLDQLSENRSCRPMADLSDMFPFLLNKFIPKPNPICAFNFNVF